MSKERATEETPVEDPLDLDDMLPTQKWFNVLYWLPRTALIGTILLTGYLGGAAAIHVFVVKTSPALPVMVGILFWAGFCLRYPRVLVEAGLIRGAG